MKIGQFPIIKVSEKYDDDDLFSGIVGMSPADDSAGPLLIYYLYEQGQIEKNQFSVLIHWNIFKPSNITFGGVPPEMSLDGAVAHRIAGSFHWQLTLNGMKIGDKVIEKETRLVLTDTGGTLVHMPTNDFKKTIDVLCKDQVCELYDGFYFIQNCDLDVFEPMWFQIDLHWYKFPP